MGVDSQASNSQEFERTIPGCICMPGFMNAPVAVTLKVAGNFPDHLQVSVRYDDPTGEGEPVFVHRFSLSVRQLLDGRHARMMSSSGHVYPGGNRKVVVQAQTWHWSQAVEVLIDDVDDFSMALTRFFAG